MTEKADQTAQKNRAASDILGKLGATLLSHPAALHLWHLSLPPARHS